MSSVNGLLHQKFLLFVASLWVSVSALFLSLFGFLSRTFFRIKGNDTSQMNNSNCMEQEAQAEKPGQILDSVEREAEDGAEKPENKSDCMEQEAEAEKPEQISDLVEKEAEANEPKIDFTEFSDQKEIDDLEEDEAPKFIFKFQYQTYRENDEAIVSDSLSSTTTNKYDFFSLQDSSLFVEKPEVFSLKVEELYADSIDNEKTFSNNIFPNQKLVEHEKEDNSADSAESEEKLESETYVEGSICENNIWSDHHGSKKDVQFQSEKDSIAPDSDSDSIASSYKLISRFVAASSSEGFSTDKDFESLDFEDMNVGTGYEPEDIDEEDSDTAEDIKNVEKSSSNMQNSGNEEVDSNGLEILWEHQELIEQLKMELKKVRATGLPTILEDDESPKIMEDLKPWKIDDKFHHEDRMGELHKFYKSYRERMRKFDIFNYQKMYAMGFLQSKDPLEAISNVKGSAPALTSLLSQKLLPGKRKKCNIDPTMSFIRELHGDLEMVYVGQMCLSWEILHWQYQKSLEIWDSDPYGIRRYNEVAGEFQQFQVLMQRFTENEPFEGPRIQNYVKNRCVLRSLLQVPVIREDSMKDKKGRRNRNDNDNAIKSDRLVEIMEESIRIFWRFVRADKDTLNVVQRSRKGTQIQPQDPEELELLTEIRTSLLKKEKKLKEILRSGSCVLKKFRKQQEESSSDQVLYFFSQVDMKLVARVLNMSKITTDQLLWCRSKLDKINFVRSKIHVDPSFLLFPC